MSGAHVAVNPGQANPGQGATGSAVILLCRGPLGAEAMGQLHALQRNVQQHLTDQYRAARQQKLAVSAAYHQTSDEPESPTVRLAFIDRRAPSLPDALAACRDHASVTIVPLLLPDEPALRRWLRKVVLRWVHASGSRQRIVLGAALAQQADFGRFVAQALRGVQAAAPDVRQAFAAECGGDSSGDINDDGDDWRHDPIAWSSVPDHQRVVLWCTGPRCAAKGALSLWPVLSQTVQRNPALRQHVLLMQTSCQAPCNHAPLMSVQPDGMWYGGLDEHRLLQVLAQLAPSAPSTQLAQGQVARAWQIHPAVAACATPAAAQG